MKLFSLAVVFAAVQSISACGRIYGSMQNYIVSDSYSATMFDYCDYCQDRCKGSASGFGWSYNAVANIRCNSGYKLQITHNGHEAFYTSPHSKHDIKFAATLSKTVCGTIRDNAPIYCTSYNFNCWALTNDCTGCGNYQAGKSPKCGSNNGMRKRGLKSNADDDQDPNPGWAYNKTILLEMVNNGTLKLQGLALEVYNGQRNNRNKLQSSDSFNITALHEKYYGKDSV